MRKIFLFITVAFVLPLLSIGQAADTLTYFNQQTLAASVAHYNYSAEEINGALEKKFIAAKFPKASKSKDGYMLYKGVSMPEISTVKLDFYSKVVPNGANSSLYIILSKGYDNYISKSSDPEIIANTLNFLNGFNRNAAAYRYGVAVENQNLVIKDVEKKIKKSEAEKESIEKEKSKIQSKIGDIKQKADGLKIEHENQQKSLEILRNKKATLEEMAALKKEVSKQEDLTNKARKKHEEALKNIKSKEEEVEKEDKNLAKNKAEQESLASALAVEKQKLEDLKTKLAEFQ